MKDKTKTLQTLIFKKQPNQETDTENQFVLSNLHCVTKKIKQKRTLIFEKQ